MLLYLNNDLGPVASNLANLPAHRRAIENIGLARREGYHIVTGDAGVVSTLRGSLALSPEVRAIYQRIWEELPQTGGLRITLPVHSRIVATPGAGTSPGALEIPVERMAALDAIRPTRLIAEDMDDCKFYQFVGQATAVGSLGLTLPLACQLQPGGGSRLPDFYRETKPQPGTSLVVTDSDRLCETDRLGDVARRALKTCGETDGIGTVAVINAKGVENLIPPAILNEAFNQGWSCELGRARFNQFQSENEAVRSYADLKNGINLRRFLDWGNGPRTQFWQPRYKALRAAYGLHRAACDSAPQCDRDEECECWIIQSIGSGALSQTIDAIRRTHAVKVWQSLDQHLRVEWDRIGRLVAGWCCGTTPLFAR